MLHSYKKNIYLSVHSHFFNKCLPSFYKFTDNIFIETSCILLEAGCQVVSIDSKELNFCYITCSEEAGKKSEGAKSKTIRC